MFLTHPSTRHGSRTAFVGVLLITALGLSAALAWQAVDAGRSHEAVAREAVREQTLFAAWQFTNQARRMLDDKLSKPGLEVVGKSGGRAMDLPLLHPDTDADGTWGTWRYGPTAGGAFFRMGWPGGAVSLAGPPDPGLERWIQAGLPAMLSDDGEDRWDPVIVDPGDGEGLIVFGTLPEGEAEPELVMGFRLRVPGLETPMGYAFDATLLPEALTRGRSNSELFSVTVVDRSGQALWRTEASYDSPFTASDTLGTVFGHLNTVLVLNPAQAESLTIGGFPTSRIPVALGLLVLTGGLVAAAFLQLRREAELSRLRADFVSGVSHELRTPLAQIRMFAETLLLGRVRNDEERVRSLQIIVSEAQRLTHQVGNVLLYSRSERERINVTPQAIDLGELVRELSEAFEPLARNARADLRVTTTPGLTANVDGELVRQALLNLLDNATKYGPPGQTIELGAGLVPGSRIQLWVEDEGPGIAPDAQERIWEPYYRMARHRESAVAGSGIGLAVVRKIMEALGGRARVEPSERGGARFVLELPCGRPGPGAVPSREESVPLDTVAGD